MVLLHLLKRLAQYVAALGCQMPKARLVALGLLSAQRWLGAEVVKTPNAGFVGMGAVMGQASKKHQVIGYVE